MTGPAGCQQRLTMGPPADPYTPSRPPPQPPQITPPLINPTYNEEMHGCPSSPGIGGPILSPWAHQDRTRRVNRFDIQALVHPSIIEKRTVCPTLPRGSSQIVAIICCCRTTSLKVSTKLLRPIVRFWTHGTTALPTRTAPRSTAFSLSLSNCSLCSNP
jgi:hypothetical protein